MFNSNIEIWKNAAHGGGPWTRSIGGSMDPVKTRGPCFVLSRPPLIFLQIHI